MLVKVADKIAEVLESLGIQHVFGIIGAGNVHIFDAIAKRGYSELVCVHHEQAATMAMQTYYRTHGRLAAALLTTGGGSTNGVTGVVSAWADSIPGLVIAGNENSRWTKQHGNLRMWGVQGYDSVQMVEKVTKYAVRVADPSRVVAELTMASSVALGGRPGPVWVEIPMDIQSAKVDEASFSPPTSAISEAPDGSLDEQVERVLSAIGTADRPLLWLGNGIRLAGAHPQLPTLLNALGVPALVSWAGIDMIDSDHPLIFGRAGVYGQRAANFVLQNCDYLLAIGTRLAIPQIGYDLSELARGARIDVVDIDADEAHKLGERVSEKIVCNAADFIDRLVVLAEGDPPAKKDAWIGTCRDYEREFPWVGPEHEDEGSFINSYRFMQKLNGYFKPDQVVVTDMGTALLCGHQVLRVGPEQRLMTSTGLGEMGFGLPAAIGASFALGRGEVMCLNCDGGMMMNLQELQTVVHHRLPIKLFIFNNDGYLMIKHTQKSLFNRPFVGTDKISGVSCPDYSKVAESFDIPAYQIRNWEDVDRVIPAVQEMEGPVICEVFMHPQQLFVPKLAVVSRPDGSLVSPPLEDLTPLVSMEVLERVMGEKVHQKSRSLR